ncbi:MAG TPA: hypothetical protein VJT82_01815 [Pyrinomonadaceae bacterium]|nr:hypothetical protein [Pyrinomonadaceae bacterium]
MRIRKMAGLFLIIMGLIQVFHALSSHTSDAQRLSSPFYAVVTALLFTLGAALIFWRDGKQQTRT